MSSVPPNSSAPLPMPSPSLLVSLAATPWLATILTLRAASGLLEQVGLISEEIFRGERLPVLHPSVHVTADPEYHHE
jgi:hypothetical protein